MTFAPRLSQCDENCAGTWLRCRSHTPANQPNQLRFRSYIPALLPNWLCRYPLARSFFPVPMFCSGCVCTRLLCSLALLSQSSLRQSCQQILQVFADIRDS